MDTIAERVRRLRQDLTRASARFGAPPALVAVTKTQPPERVNELIESGVSQIGENWVQEWRGKSAKLLPGFSLHWIGRLQTNKIKYIIEQVFLLHSMDRPSLAEEFGRQAVLSGRRAPVLVQVNVAGEAQKAGLAPGDLPEFLRQYGGHPGLEIRGLMAVMPEADDPRTIRPYFRRMRELFEETDRRSYAGVSMRELSMGMSADCIVAAEEGATIVRVGSAIFGPREAK